MRLKNTVVLAFVLSAEQIISYSKSFDKLQTTAEQMKTAQHLTICLTTHVMTFQNYEIVLIAHPVKTLTYLKTFNICKRSEIYSLESVLIQEERPKLNKQMH